MNTLLVNRKGILKGIKKEVKDIYNKLLDFNELCKCIMDKLNIT